MKKFWPLLFIVILALATWTTHYAQMTSATNSKPLGTIETLSGDDAYMKDVVLEGSFANRSSYSRFSIKDGDVYPRSEALLSSTNLRMFEKLKEEHRSFMRAKTLSTNQFYVHNDTIAYVESMGEHEHTHIDMTFESKGAHTTSFTLDVPLNEPISWTSTYRLTLQGDIAYVLVNVMLTNGTERLYGISMNIVEQTLIEAKLLAEAVDEGENDHFISFLSESFSMHHEDYFVYVTGEMSQQAFEGDYMHRSEEIVIWNTLTNTEATLEMPEHMQYVERNLTVKGNLLLFSIIQDDHSIVIERYDLDAQKWLEPLIIDVPSEILAMPMFAVVTTENQMYMSITTMDGTMISIIDPHANNILYTGMLRTDFNDLISIYYAFEQ